MYYSHGLSCYLENVKGWCTTLIVCGLSGYLKNVKGWCTTLMVSLVIRRMLKVGALLSLSLWLSGEC